MATLKDVALRANVDMLTAYHALKGFDHIPQAIQETVNQTASTLKYTLRITQIDVADLAGVAKGTVSYALNDSPLITESTRQKVRDAAVALGYRLNTMARNLRQNKTGVIGYSWHIADDPSMMNSLLDRFIYRVMQAAEAQGFHLLTFIQPRENAEKMYDDLISTNRVDGFILSDMNYHDLRISRLEALKAPFVAFGGMSLPDARFPYVDVDGQAGMRLVIQHLIQQGHRHIGMLNYDRGWPVGDTREIGYRSAMAEGGLSIDSDWVAYTPNILTLASEATHRLMQASTPPTAVICANDVMAFGAKTYFDEVGLRIGEDIALTGYDDDPTSEFLGITSVRQPIDDVAERLFNILYHEISGNSSDERQVVLMPKLSIRKSTAFYLTD